MLVLGQFKFFRFYVGPRVVGPEPDCKPGGSPSGLQSVTGGPLGPAYGPKVASFGWKTLH